MAIDLGVNLGGTTGEFMANVMAQRSPVGTPNHRPAHERCLGHRKTFEWCWARWIWVVLPAKVLARILKAHRAGNGWSTMATGLQ